MCRHCLNLFFGLLDTQVVRMPLIHQVLLTWQQILTKAKVKYRNPHQMSNRPEILYKMVGHKNTEMIYKVYGKYIAGETKGKLLKI